MSLPTQKPATTPIPVQLSEPEFEAFILPHLSMPKRGPKCKLGYYRVFNLILWVLYTGMQWKCLPVPHDTDGKPAIHYFDCLKTLVYICSMEPRGYAVSSDRGVQVRCVVNASPVHEQDPQSTRRNNFPGEQISRWFQFLSENLSASNYPGAAYASAIRQVAVDGLGHPQPTLFVSNNFDASARDLITRYTGRNGVEDSLGISVNFFHLDSLASEVRLNVDVDVALTVLAHGCYRWLATQLHGFDKAKPKQLYRKFVETGGQLEMQADRIVVHFDKRAHNPILREAALDKACPPIPWLHNLPVAFAYP